MADIDVRKLAVIAYGGYAPDPQDPQKTTTPPQNKRQINAFRRSDVAASQATSSALEPTYEAALCAFLEPGTWLLCVVMCVCVV